jgi:predicted dehydrogenase/threonine dehydrogenase-like Zn-dependent dehydrogenase
MKQVFQDISSGETKVIEVPIPVAARGMALVRTGASLISSGTERSVLEFAQKGLIGKARSRPDLVRQTLDKLKREGLASTLQAVRGRLGEPLPLGYSSAGVIVEVGEGLEEFQPGDRVACAGGGYAVHAEYALVPRNLLARMPDNLSFEEGAFATLVAIALHGFRLSGATIGEKVCVVGMGLIGHLAVSVARAAGCQVMGVETDKERVNKAQELGIHTVSPLKAAEAGVAFTDGIGFDTVLICAQAQGNEVVELAAEIARDRARIVAVGDVGMELPRRSYYEKELDLIVARSYGPGRYDGNYEEGGHDYPVGYVRWTEGRNLNTAVQLIAAGRLQVSPLVGSTVSVEDAPSAYDLLVGSKRPLAVLLTYPEGGGEELDRKVKIGSGATSTSEIMQMGAIGAGNFARSVLFPILRKNKKVRLVGVATASGLSGAETAKQFGFEYAVTDLQRILDDEKINSIAVLTKHHLHAKQVIQGLEAGKHVFCEKPLALTRDELSMVQEALTVAPGLLTVGFNRRFAPLATQMKEHFADVNEALFIHCRVNAGFLPKDHWLHDPAIGGGRVIGELCHFMDFITHLTNSLPSQVHAFGMPDGGKYRGDNISVRVRFNDGSLGAIDYLAKGDRGFGKERIEVMGGGRMAVIDDFRELRLSAEGRTRKTRSRMDKGHRAIWQAWIESIQSGIPPIPYDQLFAVSTFTIAANESLRSGKEVELQLKSPSTESSPESSQQE